MNEDNKYPVIHNFVWNWQSACLTMWIISSMVLLIGGAWEDGDYTSLYLWLIALALGYCIYMLSLVAGEFLSYQLRILFAKNLSDKEKGLACINLLDAVAQKASCESYRINGKGYVVIVAESALTTPPSSESEHKVVQQVQELIRTLNEHQQKKCDNQDKLISKA